MNTAMREVSVSDTADAVVSVWCGHAGEPAGFERAADHPHYGASVVKLAVLLAVHDAFVSGRAHADETVLVTDRFTAWDGGTFDADQDDDNDDEPWLRVGERAPTRWLAERMVELSSNLASNVLVQHLGLDAVNRQCPPGMRVDRQIGDATARAAGVTNTTTAAASAAIVARIADIGGWPLQTLGRQEHREGIASGLPPGTRVAGKAGWLTGVRHDCALICPTDAPRYVLAVCTTGLPDDDALDLIRTYAAASWRDRAAPGATNLDGRTA